MIIYFSIISFSLTDTSFFTHFSSPVQQQDDVKKQASKILPKSQAVQTLSKNGYSSSIWKCEEEISEYRAQQETFYHILHTVDHRYKQNVQLPITLETEQQNWTEVYGVSYEYREISHLHNILNLATRQ